MSNFWNNYYQSLIDHQRPGADWGSVPRRNMGQPNMGVHGLNNYQTDYDPGIYAQITGMPQINSPESMKRVSQDAQSILQSPQKAGGGGNMLNALGGWGSIISGGIGSIFGGINAYQQSKAHNRQIKAMTKGLDRQDRQLAGMEADAQTRGTGQAGNILNQYAMSRDQNMQGGYSQMYGQNLSGMHSTLGQLGQQRAEIGMQREALQGQKLDGSQLFMNTLGGALGGASQFQNLLGGFESNIFARNQRRSLQGYMDSNPNFWQDYFNR